MENVLFRAVKSFTVYGVPSRDVLNVLNAPGVPVYVHALPQPAPMAMFRVYWVVPIGDLSNSEKIGVDARR